MRLIKVVLAGYKRFMLSNIQKLTYTPAALEQVILGSNGSGKSSLLYELLNMIPNGRDFAKGGYEEKHLEHSGHSFVLISRFPVRAGHHEFWMDGVNLNEERLQATQRELVEQHLGVTDTLVDLLTGRLRFSKMSPAQRRECLMSISGTDFTFALEMYELFRTKTTGLKGTIDYLLENTKKMAEEIQSLEEDYRGKDQEIEQLTQMVEEINRLVLQRGVRADSRKLAADMHRHYDTVKQRSNQILAETFRRNEAMRGKDQFDLEHSREVLNNQIMELRGECNEHEKALEGIQSLINHVGREALDNPSQLENEVRDLEAEIAQLHAQGAYYDCQGESPDRLLAVAESVQQRLSELCVTIPSNAQGTFTRGGHQTNLATLRSLEGYILECNNTISKLEAQLEHASHTAETNCPSCKFAFKPGWDPQLLERMRVRVGELYQEVEVKRQEVGQLQVAVDEFEGYSLKVSELARIREGSKLLKAFWDGVAEEQLVRNWPAKIPVRLAEAIHSLKNLSRVERLTRDLNERKSRLELVKNSGDPKYLLQRADLMESQLFDKTQAINGKLVEMGVLAEEIYHIEKLHTLTAEMQEALEHFEGTRERLATSLEEDCLNEVKEKALARLGILHQQTQRYRDLLTRHGNNEEMLADAEEQFSLCKLLSRSLSPTEGIIAETVKNFIGHFVGMLNEHIGMVWNYDLEVKGVVEDGVNLTCKFPFRVATSDDDVPDIAEGSTGQVSMIDFAFKLVYAELMGITDFPLLADEFGKDFDPEHRERLVSYIKSLMEQNRFSQLFMVSHYSSVYGSFNQAEFVVLDDRNITRPSTCNEQVEIE